MPRAIWSGTISFGLVSVPVKMFSAVSEHKLHFSLLHRKDNSPIGYQKVSKKTGKTVEDDEIVKAYEVSKGEFVEVEDEDFEAARAEGYHAFDIQEFVEVDEIDPIYFEQRTTSRLPTAARRSTRCSCGRWRTRGSPRSGRS